MDTLINALAQNEIHVARYYFSRAAYIAAVNRCKYVIEHYQRTSAIEDALGIQVKAYKMMGLDQLANDTLRVLKQNFPHSRYIEEVKNLVADLAVKRPD
jgi:outer membrane protein assembly factor BamD